MVSDFHKVGSESRVELLRGIVNEREKNVVFPDGVKLAGWFGGLVLLTELDVRSFKIDKIYTVYPLTTWHTKAS